MRRTFAVMAAAATLLVPAAAGATADAWQAAEQQLVYEINLARRDPAAFARSLGFSAVGLLPRPPLAVDDMLAASASHRADDLAAGGAFGHLAHDGRWPNEVVRDYGYPLPYWWSDGSNNVESIASAPTFPWDLIFSQHGIHLVHLFGQEGFVTHREIGVGINGRFWAVHTAYRNGDASRYLTGVVFADRDGDLVMDRGEGLSGVRVATGSAATISGPGGGWALAVSPGRYRVTASGGAFSGTATATVRVGEFNVGIDFVSGRARGLVFGYALCQGEEPTILGTSRGETIYGTAGDDVIQAMGGRDTVRGGGGNDLICGGGGDDTLYGESGFDRLLGGAGSDVCREAESRSGCEKS